ncbi:hypothetical protein BH11MYX2_BH11MYX2_04560 [soil metagenome]
MAVPQQLLQQLLALDESVRLELAHALLDSVEVPDEMSPAERTKLDAAIARSIEELNAGKGIPIEQAIAEIRAKRAGRARATR